MLQQCLHELPLIITSSGCGFLNKSVAACWGTPSQSFGSSQRRKVSGEKWDVETLGKATTVSHKSLLAFVLLACPSGSGDELCVLCLGAFVSAVDCRPCL